MLASHTTHDAPERTEARRPDASSQLQTTHDAEAAAQASKAFLLGFRSSEAPAELGLPRAEPLPSCEAIARPPWRHHRSSLRKAPGASPCWNFSSVLC